MLYCMGCLPHFRTGLDTLGGFQLRRNVRTWLAFFYLLVVVNYAKRACAANRRLAKGRCF